MLNSNSRDAEEGGMHDYLLGSCGHLLLLQGLSHWSPPLGTEQHVPACLAVQYAAHIQ